MKKRGSALITVIVAIVVLSVLALAFIGSRKEKAGISKLLSDEKKCEAIAESASDLILSYIRKNANKFENSSGNQLFHLLRAPLKVKSYPPSAAGENLKLDHTEAKPLENLGDYVDVLSVLQPVINDIGWKDKVTIESKCEISSAEFFAPIIEGYQVAAIDKEHLPARGDSAQFLDSTFDNIKDAYEKSSDWKPSEWKLLIKFPSSDDAPNFSKDTKESHSFKIHISRSTETYDVLSTLEDAHKEASRARENLRQAEDDLKQAEIDGENPEKIAELKSKIALLKVEVEKAEAHDKEITEDYKDDLAELKTNKGFSVRVDLDIKRDNPDDMIFKFHAELHSKLLKWVAKLLGIKTEYDAPGDFDPINCQKLLDEAHFFPSIDSMDMNGLRKAVMSEPSDNPSYDFGNYVNDIKKRMNEVTSEYNGYNLTGNTFDGNTKVIEKGAILKITTKVTYKQSENKELTRTLVAEIPFKVSDIQPIAPEYSLFIANSKLLCNQGDMANYNQLGGPVDLNNATDQEFHNASLAAGRFVIHNIPNPDGKPKPSYNDIGGYTSSVPGMIRINKHYNGEDDSTTQIRSFIGTLSEPEITELNQMFSPYYKVDDSNYFNTRFSFFWADDAADSGNAKRFHEVELPVLFEERDINHHLEEPGVKGFLNVYRRNGFNLVMVPTLLYGQGHMEYPLGINPEGPIDSVYSRIRVSGKANANVSPHGFVECSDIFFSYEPVCTRTDNRKYAFDGTAMERGKYKPAKYGMINHYGYDENDSWLSNDDHKYMPANCYDAMQYAKKATRFYETGSEFVADMNKAQYKGGLRDSSGNVVLEGVYYIKDSVELDGTTFKGRGLIVAKNCIDINGDIKKADDETVIGIIARNGMITFNCSEVHAACFSNNAPIAPELGTKIYGNLVTNDFVRKDLLNVEVTYDRTVTSVTPFSTLRNIGKFEPNRYVVAFADNWSKFAYEKNK